MRIFKEEQSKSFDFSSKSFLLLLFFSFGNSLFLQKLSKNKTNDNENVIFTYLSRQINKNITFSSGWLVSLSTSLNISQLSIIPIFSTNIQFVFLSIFQLKQKTNQMKGSVQCSFEYFRYFFTLCRKKLKRISILKVYC